MDSTPTVSSETCSIPAVGLGTYEMRGLAGAETVTTALHVGYRLVDSAVNYENEGAVGTALKRSGLSRDEFQVASKLPGRHHSVRRAQLAVEETLLRMGLDQLDFYLIHWPLPKNDRYVEAWQGLVAARERGLVKHIGTSNFLPEHTERIIKETGVAPAVNQIEIHPYFPQNAAIAHNADNGIITQAWSPLGRGSSLLIEPAVVEVASKHSRTPAQVVLRWHVQRGVVPMPKASSRDRLAENLDVFDFDLDQHDLELIAGLARPDGRLWDGDPATYFEM